jgi:hypothetical protein
MRFKDNGANSDMFESLPEISHLFPVDINPLAAPYTAARYIPLIVCHPPSLMRIRFINRVVAIRSLARPRVNTDARVAAQAFNAKCLR